MTLTSILVFKGKNSHAFIVICFVLPQILDIQVTYSRYVLPQYVIHEQI